MIYLGVRSALLESEDNECPDCKEKGTSPTSLIPNRFLRSSVNNFKNETGYIVSQKHQGIKTKYYSMLKQMYSSVLESFNII